MVVCEFCEGEGGGTAVPFLLVRRRQICIGDSPCELVGWLVVPWVSAALFFVSWGLLWGHLRPGWGSSGVIFGPCGCHLGLFGAMGASSGVILGLRGGHLCIFVGRRLPRGGRMRASAGASCRWMCSNIGNTHKTNGFSSFLKTVVDTRRCSKSGFTHISNGF